MKHPPFNAGPAASRGLEDFGSEHGARKLAHMISEAWRSVGVDVRAVVEGTARSTDGRTVYSVRMPDLINGLPKP